MTRTWTYLFLAVGAAGACGGSSSSPAEPLDAADAGAPDGAAPDTADTGSDADVAADADVPWPWPTCPERSAGPGSLAAKTAALDALVRAQHLDDELLRTVTVDDAGAVTARHHLPSSGLWTAMYLASQALRYRVTGAPEALENARVAVAGLRHLTRVTNVPGLYGRAYQRPGVAYASDAAGAAHWVASTAPGYEGWYFNDDVSKDTMDGIMFGYAVALEHFDDPELIATMRDDAVAFVAALVEHGLQIIDHHGEVTEHGRLFYSAADDFPGFNAILAAAWVRVAADASDDTFLRHIYEDCLMRLGDRTDCPVFDAVDVGSYLEVIEQYLYLYIADCQTSYDNIDMVFHAIYPLLRREQDPDLAARLRAVLEVGIWEPVEPDIAPPVHRSGHALYIFLYGALANPAPDDAVFRAAVADGLCTLHQLPADRAERDIAAGTQEAVCTNRLDDPNAAEVIPLAERYYDNYLWRLDPYEIPQAREARPGLVHSPEDYLLAYWLGRYHGFVSPAE